MRPRLLFLLVLFACVFTQSPAQVYEPGLLVRANGDTLRGELENGFWAEPPAFIRFRRAPGSASELFRPRQLRAVSLTGGRYFRYEALPIDHAAETRLDMLREGIVHGVQVDSLLAEVLIEGPTMLWRVAQLWAVHFLVRRPGQPVLEMSAYMYSPSVSWVGSRVKIVGFFCHWAHTNSCGVSPRKRLSRLAWL